MEVHERINFGNHPTPEMEYFRVNEESYKDGYGSDGKIGPYLDEVDCSVEFHEEIILLSDEVPVTPQSPPH